MASPLPEPSRDDVIAATEPTRAEVLSAERATEPTRVDVLCAEHALRPLASTRPAPDAGEIAGAA